MESGGYAGEPGYATTLERGSRRLSGGPSAVGYLVVVALVAVAVLLYFLDAHTASGGPLDKRGTGFVLGEISGIIAAVLLPIAVILASRTAVLEYLFGDLTAVYVAHGVVGLAMFGFVSFHPIMYLLGGLLIPSSFLAAAHVLVPFHVVALDWVSYIAIGAALVVTMYMRLSFGNWRLVHLLLGIAMVVTGYSILIDNSTFDTADIPSLRWYLAVIYVLGTASFLWVAVVRRIVEPKREYRIVDVAYHEAANAVELRAEPVGAPVRFEPGQFTYVDLLDSRAQIHRDFEAHPFSIASAPDDSTISLVIETSGAHTSRLREIAAADDARALLHSTYGRLVARIPERHKQIWIAGGIGITPFMSMAEDMRAHPDRYADYEVTLIVGVDRAEQAFEFGRLEDCAAACPGLDVHIWDRSVRGLPSGEEVAKLLRGDVRDYAVMLSGPEPMIADLTRQFQELGVHRGQIRAERLIGPPKAWRKASPSLRRARAATTVFFASFLLLVVVSVVSRALFA